MNLWGVFGLATDGLWHTCLRTYAASMDTVCGLKRWRALQFFAGDDGRTRAHCRACLEFRRTMTRPRQLQLEGPDKDPGEAA